LLGSASELATGRVGLSAIEKLTRVLRAAAREEKSMVQHGASAASFLRIIER
jgi:hypothetical protein